MASGYRLRNRTHADLGRNFPYLLEIQKKHELVTEGIYRHIRYPVHFCFLVFARSHALILLMANRLIAKDSVRNLNDWIRVEAVRCTMIPSN